jgi:single-strand DNA-binding protein
VGDQKEEKSMSNNVTLIGNLVDDPELRFTPSGVALAKIRLAVNRRWRGQDGEWQEDTSFFNGTVWREQAETVAESLQKGMRVIVSGRLEQRSWETQEGDRRSVVEIQIDEIGPSLRWATATVNKTQRSDSWGGSDSRSSTPTPTPTARDDYGPDEAPF